MDLISCFLVDVPLSREKAGLPVDRGNAMLLRADEMSPPTQLRYQQSGCVCDGVQIGACTEAIFVVCEELHLRWCPWPDRDLVLAVLQPDQMGVLADRLIMSQLLPEQTVSTPEAPDAGKEMG